MLEKIISGGQTGADRAALDFAIHRKIVHGGWCPRGRISEEGKIDVKYQLKETIEGGYFQRVKWNVRDSDGTVIFTLKRQLSGGSELTALVAKALGKPHLHINRATSEPWKLLLKFIYANEIRVLNVAGSRESKEPLIAEFVKDTLEKMNSSMNLKRTRRIATFPQWNDS